MTNYPQIDLSEWTQVGEGYNGQAFVSSAHPGMLLKIVRTDLGSAEKVEQEFYAAQTAYRTGLPTPKMYEMVRDGNDHGYLCEKIEGKKSFARLCADHPDQIAEYATKMAQLGHELHQMTIEENDYVVPMKRLLLTALKTSPIVSESQRKLLMEVAESLPETKNCLHGDFQPGNIIVANGQHYWIDLGWLSQGHCIMDLAHLYKMMVEDSILIPVQNLTHMSREQMLYFWCEFAKAYTGNTDVEALNQEIHPYAALDLVRSFYLHPSENPVILGYMKARLEDELRDII
jgi:uncharacterized protein (TIGR02172 family)